MKILEDNDKEFFYITYDAPLQIEGYEDTEVVYNLKLMFDDELITGKRYIEGLEVVEALIKPTSQGLHHSCQR